MTENHSDVSVFFTRKFKKAMFIIVIFLCTTIYEVELLSVNVSQSTAISHKITIYVHYYKKLIAPFQVMKTYRDRE